MLIEANKEGGKVTCATVWGLTDDNSWIKGANPLLFNGDLSEKKAFDAIIYAVTGESLGEPEPVTYGERVAASFRDGIDSFTEGCGDFFVWFVGAIPALILWAVVICILVLVIKKIGKKKTKKANKKTEQKEEKAENTNE